MNKINNKLPKSWVVKHIWDDRFKNVIIKYLNEIYDDCLDGSCGGDYYGVNENNEVHRDSFLTPFGNPTVLTIDEFIELSKPIKNQYEDEFEKQSMDFTGKILRPALGLLSDDYQIGFKEGVEKYMRHLDENNNNVKKEYNNENKTYYILSFEGDRNFNLDKIYTFEEAENKSYELSANLFVDVTILKSICTIKPITKPTEYIKISHE